MVQVRADQNFHVGFNRIYDASLASALRKIFAKHGHLFQNTGKPFNTQLAANCRSIREFDDAVTRVSFNWFDVDAYYRGSCSSDSIPDVTIPLLCIQVLATQSGFLMPVLSNCHIQASSRSA